MINVETRVTVKQQTVFHVHHGGEWADIAIGHGQGGELTGGDAWLTLNIMSSHGNYGYHGFSFSEPWWEFLLRLDKEYFLKKVMEEKDRKRFDPDQTIRNMKKHLIAHRRDAGITSSQARGAWDTIRRIDEQCSFEVEFADIMSDDDFWHEEFYDYFCYSWSYAADGLWENIWVPFMTTLRASENLQNAA